MVAIVIETKTRPSADIHFMDPSIAIERPSCAMSSYPGFLYDEIKYSEDNLTQIRTMYWETLEHFTNPDISEKQIAWAVKNKKWQTDNNFIVTYNINNKAS